MNEIGYQSKWVKAVNTAGHSYCAKWASPYTVGKPDLLMWTAGIAIPMEMKLEKKLKPGWRRTLDLTEKQKETLFRIARAGGTPLVILWEHYGINKQKVSLHQPPHIGQNLVVSEGDGIRADWPIKDIPAFVLSAVYHYYNGK